MARAPRPSRTVGGPASRNFARSAPVICFTGDGFLAARSEENCLVPDREPSRGLSSLLPLLRGLISRLRPKRSTLSVRVFDDFVTLFDGDRQSAQFVWNEVQEVVTFKRDLGTWDDICLAFRVNDRWFETSEDADGWSALSSALRRHFPTIPADWY